jgi:glycosyltransferase involved in cell wall biosynthesis
MSDIAFVLEQSLGHVAHARNLERALAHDPRVKPTVVRLEFEPRPGWQRLPGAGNWSFRASLAARTALRRRLQSGRLDAVFIHTQVAALLVADLMLRIPTVVSMDATPLNFDTLGGPYLHQRGPAIAEMAKRLVNQRAFNAATRLITWSRWAAQSLERDYGVSATRISVIPPGVDCHLFRPRDHNARSGRPRVLFVGGAFERKGGLILLEAMQRLMGRAEVDIVTGAEPIPVPPGLEVRVHRGLQPQSEELVALFRRADIFVLPSLGECFGQVIAEAMACGLPVVATRVGAIPELVSDGTTGLLVSAGSSRELGDALEALVESSALRAAMGGAGLEVARHAHDAAQNNQAILDLLIGLGAARRRAA